MHLKTGSVFVAVLFTLTLYRPLFADQIVMKNGDRLTGQIVKMENVTLVFQTSYAGEIPIQWEQISSIETDSPLHVVLEDDTAAHGVVKSIGGGRLEMQTEALTEPLTFSSDRVTAINPSREPPVKFNGRVNAGLDVKDGNTETKTYYVDGELEARTEKNRYIFGGEVNQEEESGQETADNWLLHTTYDHFMTRKWFLYGKATFEQDDFQDLNLRTTISAGSGYQFLESDIKNLSGRVGLAYVNEDYTIDGQDDDYTAGLWNVKYDQFFFDKFIQFFHNHEGIVSLEDSEDLLIRARTGLRIPLQKGFNTTFQYNWDWDNSPPPGTERVDERYLFTLGYSWQ